MTHHIAFRKNGRTVKKMGDYPSQEAAAADAKAMLAAGTIPAGVQVFACGGSAMKAAGATQKNPKKNPTVGWKQYQCMVCAHKQNISTNHTGHVFDFCDGCSWKSFGFDSKHTMNHGGRAYREFSYVGPAVFGGDAAKKNPRRLTAAASKVRTRTNPKFLTKKTTDAGVIRAFAARMPAESKKLSTNGQQLDGNWMGGNRIAAWTHDGVVVDDAGSTARERVRKAVLRTVALPLIASESHWALTGPQRKSLAGRGLYRGPAPKAKVRKPAVAKKNPAKLTILGHEVAKTAQGYAIKAYGIVKPTLKATRDFLKDHVAAELRKGVGARTNPKKKKIRAVKPKIKARGVLKLNPKRKVAKRAAAPRKRAAPKRKTVKRKRAK